MIPLRAVAITVAPFYLDPRRWALKAMSVYRDSEKVYRWHTVKTLMIYKNRTKVIGQAVTISKKFLIPVLLDAIQGRALTPGQKATVVKRGLLKLGT